MNRMKSLPLLVCALAGTAIAIVEKPSTIQFTDNLGHEKIYSFTTASTGHLIVNYWDGFAWHWADQGVPQGTTSISMPNAVTFLDSSRHQRIYAFAVGSNGHLVVNYWDGSEWQWADQGLPAGNVTVFYPNAITYLDTNGKQRIYVFAEGTNTHLVVNYWDGYAWHWADQGLPAGIACCVNQANAITYVDSNGKQRIYVFATANAGQLVVNYWDGYAWHWADQGLPSGMASVTSSHAITYRDSSGHQRIYIFAVGNGHLVVNYWDGFGWHWADQGLAPGGSNVFDVSAVAYTDAALNQWIYAAVTTSTPNHLYAHYWDGSSWHWRDQGLPAGATYLWGPNAILVGQPVEPWVFAVGSNADLELNWWTGANWAWKDQGTL